ncbi:helix-turn-helix domain-containing protein [Halomicroarcula sp. F28]|uniref:helix-turn-helix domain-containing protein n=1 Tax=Haloarcula salinisoli TaxID=2487746 RepID=UPI001C73872D|nr:helix-turn-helix domain-containing protein [Halomicroarcula salinisoli]MBX0287958.1 helix-turn-helix domain-containing protein [Halomicroarcula salinisoli]
MSENQTTFEDLLIDEEEVSETLLSETLIEYIRIGDESGSIVPQDAYEDLTNREQVVVVLLAQHALEGLDMADEQWLTPSQIAERSGIKKGSVYPAVRELDDADIVENDDGSYRIPTHSLESAKRHLEPEADA